MSEEAATNDGVVWIVEFEEQRLAGIQSAERAVAPRLPEIDFIEVRPPGEELVPVRVRDRDERAHGGILAELRDVGANRTQHRISQPPAR